jgi:hypothetical protein
MVQQMFVGLSLTCPNRMNNKKLPNLALHYKPKGYREHSNVTLNLGQLQPNPWQSEKEQRNQK